MAYLRFKDQYEKLITSNDNTCTYFLDYPTKSIKSQIKFTDEYRLKKLSLISLAKILNEKVFLDSLDYYFIEMQYLNCIFVWQLLIQMLLSQSGMI